MINILIPMAGKSQFFPETEFPFPTPLIEIGHKTIIEHVIENLSSASNQVKFIFVVNIEDCQKYHLDSTLNILTGGKCKIVRLAKETKGSACSALMAIDAIANDTPLLIANGDQIFDDEISTFIADFQFSDAGVVSFDSVHPRWSYIRLDESDMVIEAVEKYPISRHAIAGLYYFKRGNDFVNSAMQMIRKNESVNGSYFISPALNQIVLSGKKISMHKVESHRYHTFYSPQKIKEYESLIQRI